MVTLDGSLIESSGAMTGDLNLVEIVRHLEVAQVGILVLKSMKDWSRSQTYSTPQSTAVKRDNA